MSVHVAAAMALVAAVVVASALGRERLGRLHRSAVRGTDRLRLLHHARPGPTGRPIEAIARDARRLGLLFRYAPEISFARFEGRRRAYDQVLCEACLALHVEHLLTVLPPGTELDSERDRVEGVLDVAGLRIGGLP